MKASTKIDVIFAIAQPRGKFWQHAAPTHKCWSTDFVQSPFNV